MPSEPAPPSARAHALSHRVQFGETDAAGVVFYPNYLRWFDRGSHELFRALGIPLRELYERRGLSFPVVSCSAQFRAPARYDDELEIRSEVSEVSRRSLTIIHRVLLRGQEISSGTEVRSCVRVIDGALKSEELPEELRPRSG